MKRPIMEQIIDEINALFERVPKGPGVFNERSYLEQRIQIIRKHRYTEKSFQRAIRAAQREERG